MKFPGHKFELAAAARRGFSLIEILVTVALLSVIILGLVAMFNQTRRAFTSSLTQVDVLESGRSVADLIARELEQVAAVNATNLANFCVFTPALGHGPLSQVLGDPTESRTNNLQEVYFLTRYNQQWNIVGYKLLTPENGIGTLYRFSLNNISTANLLNILVTNRPTPLNIFTNAIAPGTNFSRLVDGVVDFRIRPYDTKGTSLPVVVFWNSGGTAIISTQTNFATADISSQFYGTALPAYVEVELGILEDRALSRWTSLTNAGIDPGTPAWTYLSNHAGQVHVFRQRVAVRGADPTAYQ